MEKLVGVCGITCSECPALKATLTNDDELRKSTAEVWSKEYGADIKPEHINCEGCMTESDVKISHCSECEIRACGVERGLSNCAECDDYACEKLEKFFTMVPDAKVTLDEIRGNLN